MLLEQFLAQSSSETLPPEVVGNKNRESQPGNVQREGDLGILIQIPQGSGNSLEMQAERM